MRSKTVDIRAEAEEIRTSRLPEVEDAQDQLVAELKEEYEDFSKVPDVEEKAFNALEEERIELEGQAQALENAVEAWDGGEFVIQELTTGQIAHITDAVSEKSFDFDPHEGELKGGTPKQGFGKIETLRQAIVQWPTDAPTRKDEHGNTGPAPADYPYQVGEYLYEKVNSLNTVGDTDMGNSSLRERMRSSSDSSGS